LRTIIAVLAFGITLLALSGGGIASTETVLHTFIGGNNDGTHPRSGVVLDSDGALYGLTNGGGDLSCNSGFGCGIVFRLTPPASGGGIWTETVIEAFNGANGGNPSGSDLLIGSSGGLFSTTYLGGLANWGTVFHLGPPAVSGGTWNETMLRSFGRYVNQPGTGVLAGTGGELYGTTLSGGAFSNPPTGTVFQLSPPLLGSGAWTLTVIHSFLGGPTDGDEPIGGLIADGSGTLYGMTSGGGASGLGVVYALIPPAIAGGVWAETILHSFGGSDGDGDSPTGKLLAGKAGTLYGVTESGGGPNSGGIVFELTPPTVSGEAWTETILHAFDSATEVYGPSGGLVADGNGSLYGTTAFARGGSGSVFRLDPPIVAGGSWTETILHLFNGSSDGSDPIGSLVFDPENRLLYGVTEYGGSSNAGTIFSVKP
jgi:uncharacterized repeat protein (TIGR03803 family)